MKQPDIVVLGAGHSAKIIAETVAAKKKSCLVIALPGNPEDYLRRLLLAVAGKTESPSTMPSNMETIAASEMPCFLDEHTLEVNGEKISARRFVIASGALAASTETGLSPLDALTGTVKGTVSVIGAGPIGVATAAKLSKAGSTVQLFARGPRLLSRFDADIAAAAQSYLEHLGITVRLNASGGVGGQTVMATGLRPNTDGMGLKKAFIYAGTDGRVVINEEMRTSAPHVHAVGPVTGGVLNLAFETFQAETAAENAFAPFFNRQKLQPEPYPIVLSMAPPLAAVGETEGPTEKKRGLLSVTVSDGFWRMKLTAKKRSAEVVGAQLFGPGADTTIMYITLLMRAGISLRDVSETHQYPTPGPAGLLAEAIRSWLEKAA